MSSTHADPITYKLRTIFTMPDEQSGGIRAISFASTDSSQILAGYSIIITFIFMSFWDLVATGAMMWRLPEKSPAKRTITLVGLWNSNDAWTAVFLMLKRLQVELGLYNVIMFALSAAIAGGGLAVGILGPEKLIIGHVAPVSEWPQVLFYPDFREDGAGTLTSANGFTGLPILRALGTAGGLPSSLKDQVKRTYTQITQTDEGVEVPGAQITWSYQLTGVDFGLQTASRLSNYVEGACETSYDWLEARDTSSEDGDIMDTYVLWDGEVATITKIEPNIKKPPAALFFLDFDRYEQEYLETGLAHFAIVIGSAHRFSTTIQSSDPWYLTEPIPEDAIEVVPDGAIAWVKDRRPALVCWQKDYWSYNGHNTTLEKLGEMPELNLAPVLTSILQDSMMIPKIYEIGLFQGPMAILSGASFVDMKMNAEKSFLQSDFSLLARASYILTRDTFKDTTLVTERFNLPNIFQNADGGPQPGSGDFVIATTDVDTYSVTWLILVPAVLCGLWLIRLLLKKIRHSSDVTGTWWWAYYLQRCKAYDAIEVYRSVTRLCMYIEQKDGSIHDYCPAVVVDPSGHAVYLQPLYGSPNPQELANAQAEQYTASPTSPAEEKSVSPKQQEMYDTSTVGELC